MQKRLADLEAHYPLRGGKKKHGGFAKVKVRFLGVPRIRFMAFWSLYRGPTIDGNYHIHSKACFKGPGDIYYYT